MKDKQSTSFKKCFESCHMTPEEFGFWNLFRSLSHKKGRLIFSGREIALLFDNTGWDLPKQKNTPTKDRRAIGVNKAGEIRRVLEERGWIKCIVAPNSVRLPNGQFAPPEYVVLDHETWAKEHSNACAAAADEACRRKSNVTKPKGVVTVGKQEGTASQGGVFDNGSYEPAPNLCNDNEMAQSRIAVIASDRAHPYVQGTDGCAGRNLRSDQKPAILDENTVHTHRYKAHPYVSITDKPLFVSSLPQNKSGDDNAAGTGVHGQFCPCCNALNESDTTVCFFCGKQVEHGDWLAKAMTEAEHIAKMEERFVDLPVSESNFVFFCSLTDPERNALLKSRFAEECMKYVERERVEMFGKEGEQNVE